MIRGLHDGIEMKELFGSPVNTNMSLDDGLSSLRYIEALKDAIGDGPPYCSGVVTPSDFQLYYATDGKDARRIDLSKATDDDLQELAQACTPATFGRNNEDVLDESYRKAGKLDTSDFAANFFPLSCEDIVCVLREHLLEGHDTNRSIKTELYKLNIYGPGSFFKAHKDTPRAENMFGSLVVVYPTPHEGGALILRHRGKKWEFDSGKILATQNEPRLSYIAFYADVEHEVTTVTSGYRITLTYDLYFTDPDPAEETRGPSIIRRPISKDPRESEFRNVLERSLDDPDFMPDGGTLGFGLKYQYPVKDGMNKILDVPINSVSRALRCLRGSDAMVMNVAKELSLKASLHILYAYDGDDSVVMMEDFLPLSGWPLDRDVSGHLIGIGGSLTNEKSLLRNGRLELRRPSWETYSTIKWVTDMTKFNGFQDPYVAYGDSGEGTLGLLYGNMVLIVHVGPYRRRQWPSRKKGT
ncbi:hypothetical protein NEOLEDRAFT_1135586 [Neolentinus lepideus HHB14362 ss-1]|uniref:Fe2OG dioxygenase domain-containing protein n=1 Tax=Neolentinus lepideus HHB14362 ss-1 TaxID=1314782 RepID=A0A165RN17_9AGAM|nr:hypothetical protein NEOLEDRAFT_1135586 [Neolentinus lepideus HHB14362 ss-1]